MNFHQITREMPKRRARPEDGLQMAVVQHLMLRAKPNVVWHSVPNEGKRSKREGDRLKRMGLTPGVGDILVLLPPTARAAYLELKDKATGRQNKEQKEFAASVIAAGGLYRLAWDIDEALAVLLEWEAIR